VRHKTGSYDARQARATQDRLARRNATEAGTTHREYDATRRDATLVRRETGLV